MSGRPFEFEPISDEEEMAAELLWSARQGLSEREVLAAREIAFCEGDWAEGEFDSTPWGQYPPISYTRILYRDKNRDPCELLDRWAPAALASPQEMARVDDVSEFDLTQRGGTKARPCRATETVAVMEARGEERLLLELDPGSPALLVLCSWMNLVGDKLVLECRWLYIDTTLCYARNLPWEVQLRKSFPREFPGGLSPSFEGRDKWRG